MGQANVTSLDDYRFARKDEERSFMWRWKLKLLGLLNRRLLSVLVISLIMGQSAVMGELSGAAIPFWLLLYREDKKWGYFSLPVMLIPRFLILGRQPAVIFLLAVLLMAILDKITGFRFFIPLPLMAAAGFIGGCVPLLWFGMITPYGQIILGLNLLLILVVGYLIQALHGNFFTTDVTNPSQEEKVALLVIFGCLLLGFSNYPPGWLPLREMAAWLFLIVGAYVFGGGWGAGAGLIVGVVLSLNGGAQGLVIITQMALVGFLSGVFRSFGRLGCGLGFVLAVWFPTVFGISDYSLNWIGVVIPVIIFFIMPRKSILKMRKLEVILHPIAARGGAGGEMRQSLSRKVRDFSLVFKQLADAFSATASGSEQYDMVDTVSRLAEKVCSGCMFYRRCWQKDYYITYQSICSLMVSADKPVTADMLPAPISKYCPRAKELAGAINKYQELLQVETMWQQRLMESQELVSNQLTGLAQVMNELAQEINLNRIDEPFTEKEGLIKTGVAQDNASPGEVCGDAYRIFSHRDEYYLVISDGMGKGFPARNDSDAALNLFQSLIQAGFKRELSLRTVNTLLKLRGQESFATLDLAVLNMPEKLMELIKIGAPPSYLVREKEVYALKGGSPPIGMLDKVNPGFARQQLHKGDLLVMVSDGVIEPQDQEKWLQEFLQCNHNMDPVKLCRNLLAELKNKAGLDDDRTVLAVQVV